MGQWFRRLFVMLLVLPAVSGMAWAGVRAVPFGGREMVVYLPARLPPAGMRALVVVLHGGLGNASRIEDGRSEAGLKMDAQAEAGGFVVAYLNGTPVTRFMGPAALGWNAGGGCCGMSARNQVDDVAYVNGAITDLATRYGVDRGRVFGIGHSNGAMMVERLMCETGVFSAAVAISGPLNVAGESCQAARGKRVLAIHGAEDRNVPVAGGQGSEGLARVAYRSEAQTRDAFLQAGAVFTLQVVPGADHRLDDIEAALRRSEGQTIARKASRYFGLAN